jgi:hypothetical protein
VQSPKGQAGVAVGKNGLVVILVNPLNLPPRRGGGDSDPSSSHGERVSLISSDFLIFKDVMHNILIVNFSSDSTNRAKQNQTHSVDEVKYSCSSCQSI